MSAKKEKLLFILYIVGFFAMAMTMAIFQPLGDTWPVMANPPDEHARFLVPYYISQTGRIPTGFEEAVRIPSYGFSYALYNAFPYIVQGYVMWIVEQFTDSALALLYAARFVNVASGLCMAVVVYKLAGRVFADTKMKFVFAFSVMYLPMNIFIHTYINTDSFCLTSTAMMVYAWVCAYKDGYNKKNVAWLCAGIILCALSYYNAYGFIVSSILIFLAFFLCKKDDKWNYDFKGMLRVGIPICVVVLLGIGWWFIRSAILYDGDFIGIATRQKMMEMYAEDYVNPLNAVTYKSRGYTLWQMIQETGYFDGMFVSFIAAFGSVSIIGNIWMYRMFKLFFYVGIAGFLLIRSKEKVEKRPRYIVFHLSMLLSIALPFILTIHYAYTLDFQNQGRYILPIIVPLMIYVVRGIEKLVSLKKLPKWVGAVVSAAAILLFVGSSLYMVYGLSLPLFLETGVEML